MEDRHLRDIRSAPFAWQHRAAIDALLGHYGGQSRATALGLYTALTYLASAQRTPDQARAFVAEIAETVGLGKSTVRQYLSEFELLGILTVERSMVGGRMNDMNKYLLTDPPPASRRGTPADRHIPPPASRTTPPADGRQPPEQIQDEEEDQQQEGVLLLAELLDLGITPATARALVASDGCAAAGWLDWLYSVPADDKPDRPAGFLVAKVRAGEEAPPPRNRWAIPRR